MSDLPSELESLNDQKLPGAVTIEEWCDYWLNDKHHWRADDCNVGDVLPDLKAASEFILRVKAALPRILTALAAHADKPTPAEPHADAGKMVAVGESRDFEMRIEPVDSWGKWVLELKINGQWIALHTDYRAVLDKMEATLHNWRPTTAETERLRGECERLTRERDAMLAELQRIATFHVGTTYPVPEGEPPLWVQNRSVIGRCEDDARKANELLRRAKETLIDADDDIGEWCQLAQRQHDELLPVGHHPLAPTPGGIAKSRNMQKRIRAALKAIHQAFTN